MTARPSFGHETWKFVHYVTGALWGGVMVLGIVEFLAFGMKGLISSVPLIFVSSMWANLMMHLQKAQAHKIEEKADENSSG